MRILFLFLLSIFFVPIWAFNGLFQTSYDARYFGMGGAITAVGGSVMDLESNPSHLAKIAEKKISFGSSLHLPQIKYNDLYLDENLNHHYTNSIQQFPKAALPFIGYISPIGTNMGFGIALYTQGGGGGETNGIKRNTTDLRTISEIYKIDVPIVGNSKQIIEDIHYRFMINKLTSGFGFHIGKLKMGFALDLVHSFMEMDKILKDPLFKIPLPGSFTYHSNPAYSIGGKIGLTYNLNENVRIGYSYLSKNTLRMDGNIRIASHSLDRQMSLDVSRNMYVPDRHSIGIAYTYPKGIVSIDIKTISWNDAFFSNQFVLSQSWMSTPLGVNSNIIKFNTRWKKQFIFALGTEYYLSEKYTIRAGYNYGNSPIAERGINPFIGTISEHHVSTGIGVNFSKFKLNFSGEYSFLNRVKSQLYNDWTIAHVVYSSQYIRPLSFVHSREMKVYSFYFSIDYLLF